MSVHVFTSHDMEHEQSIPRKYLLKAEKELIEAYRSKNPKAYKCYELNIKGWELSIKDIEGDLVNTTIDLKQACSFEYDAYQESIVFKYGDKKAELMFSTDLIDSDKIVYTGMRYMY